MLEQAVEEETQRERRKLDAAHIRLAKIQAGRANLHTLQEAGAQRTLHDVRRETGMGEVGQHVMFFHSQRSISSFLFAYLLDDDFSWYMSS